MFIVRVGEDKDGYRNIVSAFDNSVIGSYRRLIMMSTLHPLIANIPILVILTCNTFAHKMVEEKHLVHHLIGTAGEEKCFSL